VHIGIVLHSKKKGFNCLSAHSNVINVASCRDFSTLFQIESRNFQIESWCLKSNINISNRIAKRVQSRFKSQSQLGFAHHCRTYVRPRLSWWRESAWLWINRQMAAQWSYDAAYERAVQPFLSSASTSAPCCCSNIARQPTWPLDAAQCIATDSAHELSTAICSYLITLMEQIPLPFI